MTKLSYQILINGKSIHHVIKCRPTAFRTFNFYKVGDWYNYPAADGKVETVTMIRSDGKVFSK